MTLTEFKHNVNSVDFKEIVIDSAMNEKELIAEFNKAQLWDGVTHEGYEIRPYYSEDPYFKSAQSAERYASWKQKITPNSRRNKDVPNLFVVGEFYKSIQAKRERDYIEVTSETTLGKKITNKFDNILGLNEPNLAELSETILPNIITKLKYELTK